jgi:nicotinic acid mononucleotide adenylyltransferase
VKLASAFIPSEHRLAMCEKAIEEADSSDWLKVDRWESVCNSFFVDFPDVHESLVKYIRQSLPSHKIRVLYLCGSDLFLRWGSFNDMMNQPKDLGIVVLVRHDSISVKNSRHLVSDENKGLWVIETDTVETNDLSSTMIRQLKDKNQDFSHLTFKAVAQYMLDHNL